ncbi:lysozyme family protein [Anaerostipes amylophilus]|uniref:Lysozyme family protein n=1 Tax=Anaerostipes amylophilus TaxID=2981779 RepID=A0ABV1IRU9_9FIRM
MRDIKERVRDKNPKIRNPAARLPKELVRSAVLEAKEKPRELHEKSSGQSDSPTQYGTEKIESVQYRAASVAGKTIGKTTYRGGKKLAGVTYRKIKERKNGQEEVKAAEGAMEQGAENGKKLIKLKPEQAALAKENGKRQVKVAPKVVKVSGLSQEKIKTQASMQKQQMGKSLQAMQKTRAVQMARKSAQASAESGKAVLQVTGKGSKLSVQGITAAIQKGVVALEKMGKWIAAGGGAFLLVFILIVGIIAGAAFSSNSESSESLSEEVLAYTSVIQQYASQYGIPEYVSAIQAIMMQESGGRGTDPMQCSESPYNTRFPHTPGSITDPDYSIEVGVQTFADCIRQAGCSSPQDLDKLKLAWQGYNYGNGYIGWALQRGGYTEANALQFSQEQAASHGWSSYGDPQYVPHVMRYYSGGSLFAGLFGNQQIVSVAMGQLGNSGGQKFWSWYGFDSRVEWCACFVSWCADQSGLIASGNVPKFSLCSDGVSWFQGKNKWQSGGTTPTAGMIIFFDWDHDGTSDHVGIVEKCEGGRVYTIEGNSSDQVRQRNYAVDYSSIMGYGVIN